MTDIPNQTKWIKVFQNLATDLKAEVALAALSEIIVKQTTAANLKAEVALAALSEIIVKQSTPANLTALVTLAGLRGIIPNPITAARINVDAFVPAATLTMLYTVPAAQKLFLSSLWLMGINQDAILHSISLFIRNASDVDVATLLYLTMPSITSTHETRNYFPALEVSANYDIYVPATPAGTTGWAGLSGWLEAV